MRQRRIGITDGDVARPAIGDRIGNVLAAGRLERLHDLQHAEATARAQVDRRHAAHVVQVFECRDMAAGQIGHVDERWFQEIGQPDK